MAVQDHLEDLKWSNKILINEVFSKTHLQKMPHTHTHTHTHTCTRTYTHTHSHIHATHTHTTQTHTHIHTIFNRNRCLGLM